MKYAFFSLLLFTGLLCSAQSSQPMPALAHTIHPDLTCSPLPCRLTNTRVTRGGHTTSTAPNLAINPQNSLQMILAVEDSSCTSFGAAYSTNDAGSTWTKTCLPDVGVLDDIGTTWMAYDNNGEVHALIGTFNADCGENLGLESHSTDNGLTWSPLNQVFSVLFATFDSQAIDNSSTSPFAGAIYASATEYTSTEQIVVWHSTDGGATWKSSLAAHLPRTLGFDSEGFSHLEVGKDGTVYMAYMASSNSTSTPNEMMFTKSIDGGQTWSSPVQIYSATGIGQIPNTTIFVGDAPVLAVDNSASGNSRLWVTFYNWTGSFMQVLVTNSVDGGNTWSVPVPVAPSATNDQFKPYISVSSTGSVAVTWLDRRDDSSNTNYRTYVAFSRSGVFPRSVPLAKVSSAPTNGLFITSSPAANAWSGSTLYSVWPDTRTGGVLQQFIGGYAH